MSNPLIPTMKIAILLYLPLLGHAAELLIRICFLNPASTASPSTRGWRGGQSSRCGQH